MMPCASQSMLTSASAVDSRSWEQQQMWHGVGSWNPNSKVLLPDILTQSVRWAQACFNKPFGGSDAC